MLRDYQIELRDKCVELLHTYKIAYLSMEVRTGKTLTALSSANVYGAKRVLFLTKKKAITSIENDFKAAGFTFDLTVTNYEQVGKLNTEYDLVILDEAHSLGQFPVPAKKINQIKVICKGLPIIYLSGTPTPESYSQLFHQFYVSSFSPFVHTNFYKWAAEYVTVQKKYFFNRQINDYSCADEKRIKDETSHLFLSFTQKEAGFEMMVEEEVLRVVMKESTYKLAERLRIHKVYSSNGHDILADTEVKLRSKLHQIFSGSVIDEAGEVICFDLSKAEYIAKHFRGKKIAIYYKYKGEEQIIRSVFNNLTPSPEDFNNSNDLIFYSQVQSGREGVNVSTADCLIMFNIDYSAVSYFQARARLQTKDRVKAAKVYWLFSVGGIEEKIYKAVSNKKDYTLSYFKNDFGKGNTSENKKAVGTVGMDGHQTDSNQHERNPGPIMSSQ